ncbi:MAG: hypothetical protein JRM85_06795 [Nitrososphaerota archaeon]|nr:hypothetical protein [Nitrososphaerota archaeon]
MAKKLTVRRGRASRRSAKHGSGSPAIKGRATRKRSHRQRQGVPKAGSKQSIMSALDALRLDLASSNRAYESLGLRLAAIEGKAGELASAVEAVAARSAEEFGRRIDDLSKRVDLLAESKSDSQSLSSAIAEVNAASESGIGEVSERLSAAEQKLTQEVEGLKSRADSLAGEAASISARVAGLEGEVVPSLRADAEAYGDAMARSVSEVSEKIEAAERGLRGSVSTLGESMGAKLEAAKADLEGIRRSHGALERAHASMAQRQDSAERAMRSLVERLDSLDQRLGALGRELSSFVLRQDAADQVREALGKKVDDLALRQSSVEQRVESSGADVAGAVLKLQAEVDGLRTELKDALRSVLRTAA